jgi:hypothetical protein
MQHLRVVGCPVTAMRQLLRRSAARHVALIGLVTLAALVLTQPTSALVCAREWGGDTFAGARQAVTEPTRWDGLLVATVTAVERKDDYWRTRVLVLEPEIVFSGSLRETVRAEIGGHGPDMSFDAGSTYFLSLVESRDAASPGRFVHPCGPNMAIDRGQQVAELRSISDTETVISEPKIQGPLIRPLVAIGIAITAVSGLWWFTRRHRSSRLATDGR